MPIPDVEQPAILPIDNTLRLRRYDGVCDFALPWYRDPDTLWAVNGNRTPYTPDMLRGMYRWQDEHSELYFIEIREGDAFRSVGDAAFSREDMAIVIGESALRGRGIGRRVVQALIRRAVVLGFAALRVGEIYSRNTASQRLFTGLGFTAGGDTARGRSYILPLRTDVQNKDGD